MEKLLYFWVDKSHKRATNSTGIRANWINCLLYIKKVLLNLHNFPLLNINCTEPYLGPLRRSYIIAQILNSKIPERVLLNGAIWKRFSKVSRRWRCAACHLLQVLTMFLDTVEYKGTRFKEKSILDVNTHFKKTETFQYTHFTSCHPPPSVKKGLVNGEALRILRTNYFKFQKNAWLTEATHKLW